MLSTVIDRFGAHPVVHNLHLRERRLTVDRRSSVPILWQRLWKTGWTWIVHVHPATI
jgi:hypothetical protein